MKTVLSKISIVSERLLKDDLIALIQEEGATGFTLSAVEGEGSRGIRAGDWEGRNVMLETLVSEATADRILTALNERFMESFAVVAWVTEVSVLRGDKFLGT
ncbi:MAG: nitrogen regulatory protein P-II 2 [Verrucomicrobiales bacterium]|jgi:nitrogen regulatory protein P-II 2